MQVIDEGLDDALRLNAGRPDPSWLRLLDASHLVAALDLGDDPEGLITYDDRLADAAVTTGVVVVTSR